MLPNFLILGAQKAGTTTLWHMLDAHPDVYLARPRETRFFHDDLLYGEGPARYELGFFSGWSGQRAVGEKCPEYLWNPQAPPRILATLGPDTRLIVTLRSPARRAHSHYRHNLAMFREARPFEEALEAESPDGPAHYAYRGRGLYARQLRRFPRDRMLIVHFEGEICRDQHALAQRVCRFLEIAPPRPAPAIRSGRPPLEGLRLRADQSQVELARPRPGGLRALLRRGPAPQRVQSPSAGLLEFAGSWERSRAALRPLDAAEEHRLNRRWFAEDLEELRELVPFDVGPWLGP